jgi:hypothetical protein
MRKIKGGARYNEHDLTQTIRINGNEVIKDKESDNEGLKDPITLEYILKKDAILVNEIIYDIDSIFNHIIFQIVKRNTNNKLVIIVGITLDVYRKPISYNDIIKIILKYSGFKNISGFICFCDYETREIEGLAKFGMKKVQLYDYVLHVFFNVPDIDKDLFYRHKYTKNDLLNTMNANGSIFIRDKVHPEYPLIDIENIEPIVNTDAYLLNNIIYNKTSLLRDLILTKCIVHMLDVEQDSRYLDELVDSYNNKIPMIEIYKLLLYYYNVKTFIDLLILIKNDKSKIELIDVDQVKLIKYFYTIICFIYLHKSLDIYKVKSIKIKNINKDSDGNSYQYFTNMLDKSSNRLPKNSIIIAKLERGHIDYVITTQEYQDKFPIKILSSIGNIEKIIEIIPYSSNKQKSLSSRSKSSSRKSSSRKSSSRKSL